MFLTQRNFLCIDTAANLNQLRLCILYSLGIINKTVINEKRKVERFDLHVETILQVKDAESKDRNQQLISRDISSDGVFLETNDPLPIGTKVDLSFFISLNKLNSYLKNKVVNISTSGMVIRADEQGVAVKFDKQHKVSVFIRGA